MKRRKQRALNQKKGKKNYKCNACQNVYISFKDYQKHVQDNLECKKKLPYSCQFCSYVGYEPYGFQKHLQCKPNCEQFYKEKEVTTGQIIDFSCGHFNNRDNGRNEASFQYKRFFPSGMQDTVQLNLCTDTLTDMDYNSKVDYLNRSIEQTADSASYMTQNRIVSSIRNESFPMDSFIENTTFDSPHQEQGSSPDEGNNQTGFLNGNMGMDNEHIDQTINNDFDFLETQSQITKRFSMMTFTHGEEAGMDLFHLLKTSNVPLAMYDRIIAWLKRHESCITQYGANGLMARSKLIDSMNKKLYGSSITLMKPKLKQTRLSSGRTSNVVVFSIKEMILKMITNKSIFQPDNLLLDPSNPCGDILDDGYYGDVNSGSWFTDSKARECTEPNHILMPFCHFIDGLSIDKYGKLSVEAVLTCCLWYNRKARN